MSLFGSYSRSSTKHPDTVAGRAAVPYTYRSPRSTRLTCPSIWQTAAAPSLSAAAAGRAEQIMRPPRREHASASMASPSARPRRGCHIGAWESIEGGGVRSTCAVGCHYPRGPLPAQERKTVAIAIHNMEESAPEGLIPAAWRVCPLALTQKLVSCGSRPHF